MSANYRVVKSQLAASILIVIMVLQAFGPFAVLPVRADGFGPTPGFVWHQFFCIGEEVCKIGDFNGDGRDDIAAFVRSTQGGEGTGDVWVALSNGQGFDPSSVWHPFFCVGEETCLVGDFNGDGKDDIAAFVRSAANSGGGGTGSVFVALSTGTDFQPQDFGALWHPFFCVGDEVCEVGDFNGDGKDDIAAFVQSTQRNSDNVGDVWVALSNGQGFNPSSVWHTLFCVALEVCGVGDFDGDNKNDIVSFVRDGSVERPGSVYVALADQPSLPEPQERAGDFGYQRLTMNGAPATGAHPLLVVLVDYPDVSSEFRSLAEYERLLFGPDEPTVAAYFNDMSYGHFTWTKTAIIGPAPAVQSLTASEQPKFIAMNSGFNFAAYDTNRDGKVVTGELAILAIDDISSEGGQAESESCYDVDGGIDVCSAVAKVGVNLPLLTTAHELSHLLGAVDLYGGWGQECLNANLTLMSCTIGVPGVFHLDPWYKIQLGWVRPKIYRLTDSGTCTTLAAPQLWPTNSLQQAEPIILYDPKVGVHEYFILEYRSPTTPLGGGYDANVAEQGVAIWYVQTDAKENLVANFVVGAPVGDHGLSALWRESHGEIGLQLLLDHLVYDAPEGLKLKVGPIAPDQAHVEVEWAYFGGPLRPRLTHATETLEPGVFEAQGMFGVNQGNRVVSLLGGGATYDVQVEQWSCNSIRFRIPPSTPSGDYQLVVYDDASHTIASNKLPLVITAEADLAIADFTVVDLPSQLMVGEAATVTLRKVITNNGPAASMDASLRVTATAPPNSVVEPTELQATELALALGEQRVIEEVLTLRCDRYGRHKFTFTAEIQPLNAADSDPDISNNQVETTAEIECVLPVVIEITPEQIQLSDNRVVTVVALDSEIGKGGLSHPFDSSTIDPLSVRFGSYDVVWNGTGGASEIHGRGHRNSRGMRFHFRALEAGLTIDDTTACLKGTWVDAEGNSYTFFGCDTVVVRD